MDAKNNGEIRDILPISAEILRQYPGQYIIFSEDEQRVIGVGDTEEKAFEQAQASGVRGLWHGTYSSLPNEWIV